MSFRNVLSFQLGPLKVVLIAEHIQFNFLNGMQLLNSSDLNKGFKGFIYVVIFFFLSFSGSEQIATTS